MFHARRPTNATTTTVITRPMTSLTTTRCLPALRRDGGRRVVRDHPGYPPVTTEVARDVSRAHRQKQFEIRHITVCRTRTGARNGRSFAGAKRFGPLVPAGTAPLYAAECTGRVRRTCADVHGACPRRAGQVRGEEVGMITPEVLEVYAQGVSTGGLQRWIQDNVVPLVLLGIAVILLWIGGRGDNAGVARRSVGLLVGLVALGIAVSGRGPDVGSFLARLITG